MLHTLHAVLRRMFSLGNAAIFALALSFGLGWRHRMAVRERITAQGIWVLWVSNRLVQTSVAHMYTTSACCDVLVYRRS